MAFYLDTSIIQMLRIGSNNFVSACTFVDAPCVSALQTLANLTGRTVTHQKLHAGGTTERRYKAAEDYDANRTLITALVEGSL